MTNRHVWIEQSVIDFATSRIGGDRNRRIRGRNIACYGRKRIDADDRKTEQPAMAVSNANMIMNRRARPAIPAEQESDGANLAHFRNEVAKQVFDAVPERCGRAWASRARTFHVQKHDAIAKAMKSDVAAV